MKAQRCILNIKWHYFVTNDSVRSQTKLTDLPLIIAERKHSLLGHVCRLPPDQMCQPTTSSSTCQPLAGQMPCPDWKSPPGRPRKTGYNRWKRIMGAQSTRCGHRCRIACCGGRYGPRWSGTAVSE